MVRRAAAKSGGIQLFSFLDILIATMGALLVLVHALAHHEETEDVKKARAAAEEAAVTVKQELEDLKWQAEQLRPSRDKTAAELSDERLKLSHVEDHERRLMRKLEQLKIAADELKRLGNTTTAERAQKQAELDETQRQLRDVQDSLEDAKQKGQTSPHSYTVVPYKGPNGTSRRPIYIECRANSIMLQPEGIELSPQDFAGYFGPGNPLASAVRATSEYIARVESKDARQEPYPLLLVRPDGIASYYAARGALTSWAADFGYELIGADWKLKFPDADPHLAELTRGVVADARQRQLEYVRTSPQVARSRPRTTYHANSHGGFTASRTGGGGGGHGRGTGGGGGGWDELGSNWANGAGGQGDSTDAGSNGDGTQSGSFSGTPSDVMGSGQGTRDDRYGGDRYGARGPGGSGYGSEKSGSGAGSTGPYNETYGSTERGGGDAQGSRYASGPGGSSNGVPGGAERYAQGDRANRANAGPYGTANGGRGDASQSGRAGTGNSTHNSGASSSQYAAGGSTASGSPSQSGGSGQSGSSGSSGQAGGSEGSSSPVGLSSTPSPFAPQGRNKPRSMASTRGSNWGLPENTAGTPATRPISIECHNDRLVLMSEDRGIGSKEIRLGEKTQDSMDELVSEVWQHMKGWGAAGKGIYWQPTLVMDVKPGAADRYAELKALLADSGMEVRERRAPAPVARKPQTGRQPSRVLDRGSRR